MPDSELLRADDVRFGDFISSLPPRARLSLVVGVASVTVLLSVAVQLLSRPAGLVGTLTVLLGAGAVGYVCAKGSHVMSWYRLCARPTEQVFALTGYAEPRSVIRPARARRVLQPSIRIHDTRAQAHESSRMLLVPTEDDPGAIVHDGWALQPRHGQVASRSLLEVAVDVAGTGPTLSVGDRVRFVGDRRRSMVITRSGVLWGRGAWLAGA